MIITPTKVRCPFLCEFPFILCVKSPVLILPTSRLGHCSLAVPGFPIIHTRSRQIEAILPIRKTRKHGVIAPVPTFVDIKIPRLGRIRALRASSIEVIIRINSCTGRCISVFGVVRHAKVCMHFVLLVVIGQRMHVVRTPAISPHEILSLICLSSYTTRPFTCIRNRILIPPVINCMGIFIGKLLVIVKRIAEIESVVF